MLERQKINKILTYYWPPAVKIHGHGVFSLSTSTHHTARPLRCLRPHSWPNRQSIFPGFARMPPEERVLHWRHLRQWRPLPERPHASRGQNAELVVKLDTTDLRAVESTWQWTFRSFFPFRSGTLWMKIMKTQWQEPDFEEAGLKAQAWWDSSLKWEPKLVCNA